MFLLKRRVREHSCVHQKRFHISCSFVRSKAGKEGILSKKSAITIYFCLKSSFKSYDYAMKKITHLSSTHNVSSVGLEGISFDEHLMTFTLGITLEGIANRKAESHEKVSNVMMFMNNVFLELFDFNPCYTVEPTEQEKDNAYEHIQMIQEITDHKEREVDYVTN